jgi:long-chain acyl-CoA synthetase
VGRGGAAVLIRSTGETLTDADLRASVSRAAAALRGAGTVGVAVADPCGFVIAALGAWEAGAAVVPLDVRAGPHWIDSAAQRAGAGALVRNAAPDGTLEVEPRAGRPLDPRVGLVLFTSGSSGPPKGVLLSRQGLEANVEAILSYLPVRQHPRTAVVLPLGYSYALVGQVLTTLRAGGTLLLLGDLPYPPLQLEAMARLEAGGLSSVPTSLRLLSQAAAESDRKPPLGYLASAGAPLGAKALQAMRAAFPGALMFNQYGLTEASPRVSAISDAEPEFARGSVGRPLPGIQVRAGDDGEIRVRGPSVMLGYLDDPEATARVLSADGELRTGDVGRVENGYLWVEGRADGVVKSGGERVSLEEVAAAARACAGVAEASVVAVPDDLLGARLVAFVEAAEAAVPAVRKALRESLPPAKRPQRIVALEKLPRLPSGKIDLRALKEMAS